jgi:hypothetical protein
MRNVYDVDIDGMGLEIYGNGVIKVHRGGRINRKRVQVRVIHDIGARV